MVVLWTWLELVLDFLGTDFLVWAKCCSSTFRPSVFSWCVPCGYSTCWWFSLWFSWECLWLSGTISGRWWIWWCTKQATVLSLWKDLQETLEHKPLGRNRFSIWIHKAEEWYTKTTVHIFPRKEAVAKSCIFANFASRGDVSHLTAICGSLRKRLLPDSSWSLGNKFPQSLGNAKSSATKIRLIT